MDKFNMYTKLKYERLKISSEAVMAINFQNLHLLSSQSELILEFSAKKETNDMKIQYLEL